MTLTFAERKKAFINAGHKISKVVQACGTSELTAAERGLYQAMEEAQNRNPWFTPAHIKQALNGIALMLDENLINSWLDPYPQIQKASQRKKIAVIMAGNLPVVGFHDFMCVLMAGHHFLGKLSSQDQILPVKIAELLAEAEPGFSNTFAFTEERISGFDAVIATGSNNSSRYFDYYFGKYPHIIRKNRSSLAVLNGTENDNQLKSLADDIFMYFGMGCRSVSKIYLPMGYDIPHLLDNFKSYEYYKDHHKYFNNYEYHKAVMLVSSIPHFDTGFCLLRENTLLSSPLAVIHYEHYNDISEPETFIESNLEQIQCISAKEGIMKSSIPVVSPGNTQNPGPEEYADGVDTLRFLTNLK